MISFKYFLEEARHYNPWKLKRIDSTHYIHPSGLNIVQHEDKSWSVYDTFENGELRNKLSLLHKTKADAASRASRIHSLSKKEKKEE